MTPKTPKKIVLSPAEQEIENLIERGELTAVSPAKKKELMAKFHAAYKNLKKGRGGARKGAGRKPSGRVRLFTQVKPETLAILQRKARGNRGIGLVIDQWAASL